MLVRSLALLTALLALSACGHHCGLGRPNWPLCAFDR